MTETPKSFITPYRCFDCGSEVGFRSRRRTFAERFLLPVFLLQPVRCGACFRRDYRLIFTPVHERLSDTNQMPVPKILPAKHRSTSDRNVA
jgi:DNA-directed RNA polymerase subunit N (RpoN/RPB10)